MIEDKTEKKNRGLSLLIMIASAAALISCGRPAAPQPTVSEASAEKLEYIEPEALDTAVFLEYGDRDDTIKLMSADNGRSYTVSINNLTTFEDNYGKVSVPELFEMGMIVDADISVHAKTLKSLKQDPDAFVRRDVTNFDMNMNRGVFALDDGTNLHITPNTAIIKNGKLVKHTDISDSDVLMLRGIEHELYSIVIMSGYGHLRIEGAEYFTGGWVQIGDMFKPVSDDMLLDVPEGEYDMIVTYKKQGGTKHVVIERGKETVVDVSDLKGDLVKTGEIFFTIRPVTAEAVVKIDGETVDHLEPVSLEYGVYQLEVSAEGYATIKERIAVGAEVANIEIELTEKSSSSSSVSSNKTTKTTPADTYTTSSNSLPVNLNGSSSSSSSYYGSSSSSSSQSSSSSSSSSSGGSSIVQGSRIYIDAPETAEVYFDGIYKGIVPCSFVKESGTHVITLRKDGYETRTFTITLDNSKENETYSFSALQEK